MREFIRHPSDLPIDYTVKDEVCENRYVKNISRGGLCFYASSYLEPGSAIVIKIPIREPEFKANGKVAWCKKNDISYDVGIKFDDTSTEFGVRMIEQVCHIETYKKEMLKVEGRKLTGEEAAHEWIQKYSAGFPR